MSVEDWAIMDVLTPIILSHVKGCIVEIGIGWSSIVFAKHSKDLNVKFYSCDKKKARCEWLKEWEGFHDNIVIYHNNSFAFAKWLKETPAIIFLDGNHTTSIVEKEISLFLPKLATNGVMFLHDTCPWQSTYEKKTAKGKDMQLYTIKNKLKKDPSLEVFTWPFTAASCGLTMILKKDMNEPWYRI
ncbi:MAG: class I SAM-dependent methyltransferase [Candidatus Hodarchaeales archaeon]|jgi:hypothetical protein